MLRLMVLQLCSGCGLKVLTCCAKLLQRHTTVSKTHWLGSTDPCEYMYAEPCAVSNMRTVSAHLAVAVLVSGSAFSPTSNTFGKYRKTCFSVSAICLASGATIVVKASDVSQPLQCTRKHL